MLSTTCRALLRAILFVALSIPALAQKVPQAVTLTVHQAPPALLQQFDVMVGTVQDLQVPNGTPAAAQIDVVFAGQQVRLDLTQFDVRTPGFQLLERTANGLVPVPTPACTTYRGAVVGEAGSEVAASLLNGSLRAWVKRGSGDLWIVQAVREVQPTAGPAVHVVYLSSDSANLTQHCGVPGTNQGFVPSVIGQDVTYACQLAIEADFPFFQANGSNTTATQNDVTSVVNAMDVIYRRDVQVALQISQMIVDTTTDPYTTSSPGTLLTQFLSYWNNNHGGIARDIAHLFTGRPMGAVSGGTIGIAYVGVVCNLGSAYGVSQSRFTNNFNYRVAVSAHEIGHNFNAAHCDSAPPCNIMCSGVGGCGNNPTSFSAGEQAQIIGFRQGLNCLAVQQTTPFISSVSIASHQTFRPAQVILTGTGFTGTTSAAVGGVPVTSSIAVLSDTQLRLTPPSGLPLGFQPLTVTNTAGTSNVAGLFYTASNPCLMSVPSAILGGNTLVWQFGGWSNDPAFLVVSLQNTTSLYQGLPLLNGYSILWIGGLDARGMGSYSVPLPSGVLNGLRAYSQLIDFDPATLLVRSVSSISSTLVLL